MHSDTAELEILDMGTEDVIGLYEIIWRFNTVWPNENIGRKYAVADELLRRLLSQRAVKVIKQRFSQGDTQYSDIPDEEAVSLLTDPVSWYPSLSDDPNTQLGYKTTALGEERYRELYKKVRA